MAITKLNSLAIPASTIVTDDLTYPLTNFSSTGIDDNASSTAITIDGSGRVGIDNTSPSTYTGAGAPSLVIGDHDGFEGVTLASSASGTGNIAFADGNSGTSQYRGLIRYDHDGDRMELWTGSGKRVTISSAGDVGYSGKLFSSNNVANLGGLQLYRDHSTGSCYLFDTTTAPYNGPLIFGTANLERMQIDAIGNLNLATGTKIHTTAGIHTDSDTKKLELTNNANETSAGVSIIEWGYQHASAGFQGDIHYVADSRGASGKHRFYEYSGSGWTNLVSIDGAGVTFDNGGNYLDDYEEGTWNPSVNAGSISGTSISYTGRYVKVGNIVTLFFRANNTAGDIQVSSYCTFSGLPFSIARSATSTVITEDIDVFSRQGYAVAGGSNLSIGKCGSSSGTTSIKCSLTTVLI